MLLAPALLLSLYLALERTPVLPQELALVLVPSSETLERQVGVLVRVEHPDHVSEMRDRRAGFEPLKLARVTFFAHSVHNQLATPHAAQLSLPFFS